MLRLAISTTIAAALFSPVVVEARELAVLTRIDADTVELAREDASPVSIWLSEDGMIDQGDRMIEAQSKARKVKLPIPATKHLYAILLEDDGSSIVVAERRLPLEQGSNFRDIGGYVTKDGHTVRWGKAFRSGAMPLLTENDYTLIGQLDIGSVVDLRSLEERSITSDLVDDRTGALFLSNDYSMRTLFAGFQANKGENIYQGMEKLLVPQYRALYRRIMADEGAVLYHCSAGQDRTGIATALLYDMLGVDRETILKDYHLSTEWRKPQWEMPEIDPADYPGNLLVQYYASRSAEERKHPEPLYARSGASHLAQFFTYLDEHYGGSEGYMKTMLEFSDDDLESLRKAMLE